MMIARYTASIGPAAALTLVLLFAMQLMIATGTGARTESQAFRIQEFVRTLPPPAPPIEDRRPDPISDPPTPPERLQPGLDEGREGTAVEIGTPVPPQITGPQRTGTGLVNGDLLPIVKILPQYPAAALQRELEGYVTVVFTVTRTGSVADVEIEESSLAIFERAATDAAYKFRYRPRVIDGEAVEVRGVRNRFTFELDR